MTLETLLAEREIYCQLVRFARAMDARDWEAIAATSAEDLVADFGTGEVTGRSEVILFIRSFLDRCGTTQHILGNVLIEVDGERAISQAYVSDMHLNQQNDSGVYFRTLGNYTDAWARVDGIWLLTHRVKDNRATVGSMDVFTR